MPARVTDRQVLKASRSEPVPSRDPGRVSVFTTILTKGPLSRAEVSRFTGLSQATVTKAVKPLIDHGYVVEEAEQGVGVGRPAIPLSINASRHYVVGIKVARREAHRRRDRHARRNSRVAASPPAEYAGRFRHRSLRLARYRAHRAGRGVRATGDRDRRGTRRPCRRFGRERPHLSSARLEGRAFRSPARGGDRPLHSGGERRQHPGRRRAVVRRWSGHPVVRRCDGGSRRGLRPRPGRRTGSRSDRRRGRDGHIVVEPGGLPCRCGKHGCVETIACDEAILTAIADAGGATLLDIGEAAAIARDGDAAAMAAFSRAGDALGRGIAALVNLVNPSRIVLSGEGVVASDLLDGGAASSHS